MKILYGSWDKDGKFIDNCKPGVLKLYFRLGMWCLDGNLCPDHHEALHRLFIYTLQSAPLNHVLRPAAPFWQCGSHVPAGGYNLIEFWSYDQTAILAAAEYICQYIGFQLEL